MGKWEEMRLYIVVKLKVYASFPQDGTHVDKLMGGMYVGMCMSVCECHVRM